MAAAAREYFGPLAGLLSAGRKAWVHSRCCRDRAKGRDGCKLPRRSLQSDCRTFWRTPERAPSRPLPGSQEEEESPRLAVDRPANSSWISSRSHPMFAEPPDNKTSEIGEPSNSSLPLASVRIKSGFKCCPQTLWINSSRRRTAESGTLKVGG